MLLTLENLARAMGWPVLATQFNRHLPGFPKPEGATEDGQPLFSFEAVREWDHVRPTVGANSFS